MDFWFSFSTYYKPSSLLSGVAVETELMLRSKAVGNTGDLGVMRGTGVAVCPSSRVDYMLYTV